MPTVKKAPVRSVRDMDRRNQDFYKAGAPPQRRRDDGSVVDERFPRKEDPLFKRQPGRHG